MGSFRQKHESGNRAVALLATCLVFLGGALGCTMVALTTDHPGSALGTAGAAMAGVILLIWLLSDKRRDNRAKTIWGWLGRRRRRKIEYRVKARLPANQRSPAPSGPPTAESVRALTGGTSTWVPAAGQQRRAGSAPPPLRERGRG